MLKMIFSKNQLLESLNLFEKLTERREVFVGFPSGIFIEANQDDQIAYLSMEVGVVDKTLISLPVAADIKGTGEILLRLETLKGSIQNLSGDLVWISTLPDEKVCIECGTYKLVMSQEFKEAYEIRRGFAEQISFSEQSEVRSFHFPFAALLEHFEQVQFTAGTDRFFDVLMRSEGETLHIVATDGHRLSHVEVPSPDEEPIDFLMPWRLIQALRIIPLVTGPIDIHLSPYQIQVIVGDYYITCYHEINEFPDYKSIVPEHVDLYIEINRKPLLEALKLLLEINGERQRDGWVILVARPGRLTFRLFTDNWEKPTIHCKHDTIHVESIDRTIALAFTPLYLFEALKAFRQDIVCLGMNAKKKRFGKAREIQEERDGPLLISSPYNPGHTQLVMPRLFSEEDIQDLLEE